MKTKHVIVEPYNPIWKEEFEKLKSFFMGILKDSIIDIEHVGSTSVEGLSAKPIIDIDVVIEDYDRFELVKSLLEGAGYFHEGDLGIKGREAFAYDSKDGFMTHHLYVCPKDSPELRKHLIFRDYLRTHEADRENYSRTKLEAAQKHPEDISSYIEAKSPRIAEIYKKCGL